jgi:hypothetical protein
MPLSANIHIQNFKKIFGELVTETFIKTVILPYTDKPNSSVRPFQKHILTTLQKETKQSRFKNSFAQVLTTAIEPALRKEIYRRGNFIQNGCDWIGEHPSTTLAVTTGVLALWYKVGTK